MSWTVKSDFCLSFYNLHFAPPTLHGWLVVKHQLLWLMFDQTLANVDIHKRETTHRCRQEARCWDLANPISRLAETCCRHARTWWNWNQSADNRGYSWPCRSPRKRSHQDKCRSSVCGFCWPVQGQGRHRTRLYGLNRMWVKPGVFVASSSKDPYPRPGM